VVRICSELTREELAFRQKVYVGAILCPSGIENAGGGRCIYLRPPHSKYGLFRALSDGPPGTLCCGKDTFFANYDKMNDQ